MQPIALDDTIEIGIWSDPVVERVGFDACGDYVELFWLPIIGPTATLLLRRLATSAILHPAQCALSTIELAASMGLGSDTGPRGSLARSVHRLVIFGFARMANRRITVRTVVPPLTLKHLARLPEHLQLAHALWTESDPFQAYNAAYWSTSKSTSTEVDLTSSVS